MVTEVGAPISSGALGGATWGGAGAVSLGAPPPRGATVASRVTLAPSPVLTDIDWGSELGAAPLLLFSLEGGYGHWFVGKNHFILFTPDGVFSLPEAIRFSSRNVNTIITRFLPKNMKSLMRCSIPGRW